MVSYKRISQSVLYYHKFIHWFLRGNDSTFIHVYALRSFSPAEPSVDLDLEYIENVFTYLER